MRMQCECHSRREIASGSKGTPKLSATKSARRGHLSPFSDVELQDALSDR